MPEVRSFTVQNNKGPSRVLVSDVRLAVAYDPSVTQETQRPPFKEFKGISCGSGKKYKKCCGK